MRRLKIAGLWILQLLLAFVMVGSGIQKFASPAWQHMFRVWGYPDGFYLVIGAIEAVAGVGLLIPRLASGSAVILAVVMASAAATQILRGGRNGVGEIVFMGLLLIIAAARWRDRLRATPPSAASTPAP